MTELWNLIQIGSIYLTDDELSTGEKLICTVEGLDIFGVGDHAGHIKALTGTVYTQLQDIVDAPVTISIPKLDSDLYDGIRDAFTAWIATPTDFTFNVTGAPENFTGTAKPRWDPKPIEFTGERLNNTILGVAVRLFVTST